MITLKINALGVCYLMPICYIKSQSCSFCLQKKKKKLAALKTEKVKTAKSNAQIKKEKLEAEEKEKWRW